jgi:hypothetical protein
VALILNISVGFLSRQGGISMTARQRVYNYFSVEKKYPSLETWLGWGYNRQYYYEVKNDWRT